MNVMINNVTMTCHYHDYDGHDFIMMTTKMNVMINNVTMICHYHDYDGDDFIMMPTK